VCLVHGMVRQKERGNRRCYLGNRFDIRQVIVDNVSGRVQNTVIVVVIITVRFVFQVTTVGNVGEQTPGVRHTRPYEPMRRGEGIKLLYTHIYLCTCIDEIGRKDENIESRTLCNVVYTRICLYNIASVYSSEIRLWGISFRGQHDVFRGYHRLSFRVPVAIVLPVYKLVLPRRSTRF